MTRAGRRSRHALRRTVWWTVPVLTLAVGVLSPAAENELDLLLQDESEEPAPTPTSTPGPSAPESSATEDHASGESPPEEPVAAPSAPLPERPPPPAQPVAPAVEEIVVTAQRRAENIQDVPIAVSALDQSAIEERGIVTLGDLTTQVASFQFGEVAGAGQASIRGVGFSLVSGTGEGSVAIHNDGLFLSRPGQATMLQQDIGGIELLRGPQGTLYGRNATAGVVNFTSPRPSEELDVGVSGGVGNFDNRSASGHVGGGLLGGMLRARMGTFWEQQDDHFINIEFPGRDQGGREQLANRLSLDLDATDSLSFELRTFHVDEDFNGVLYAAYKPPPDAVLAPPGSFSDEPYEIRTNDAGVSNRRMIGGSLKTIVDLLEPLRLSALTGFVDYRFTTDEYDGDGTSLNTFTVFREENSSTFTQEAILHWTDSPFDWLVGGFFMFETFTQTNDALVDPAAVAGAGASSFLSQIAPGIDPVLLQSSESVNIENDSDEESLNYAAFTDVTYSFTDALRLFGGARYLRDTRDHLLVSVTTAETPGGPVRNFACEEDRQSFDVQKLTGRVGSQYDVLQDAMVYGQFSTGFKSGGFAKATCGDFFEPEELDAFEVGWKSRWLGQRLRLNGALFYYDYANLQVEEVRFPEINVNNAQAEVFGAEFEAHSLLPLDGLEASLHGTFLDARYTDFLNSDNAEGLTGGPVEDLEGNVLNRSPKFAGGGSLQYLLPLGEWGSVVSRFEANYSTKYALRDFNRPTDFQPAFWLLNAHLNFFSVNEHLSVRAFVKNATDEPVLVGLLGIAGYKAASFALPRTFGAEILYLWGSR